MADTYKGESLPKKIARLRHWLHVRSWIGEARFLQGRHLVLSSREAGDVAVLLGMGVPARNIIAVDVCGEAISQAQRKYPGVSYRHADVAAVARKLVKSGDLLASAFLDFCGPIQEMVVEAATLITGAISSGGVLSVGVLRGREHGAYSSLLKAEEWKAQGGKYAELPGAIHQWDDENPSDDLSWDRDVMLWGLIRGGLSGRELVSRLGTIHYQSVTPRSRGVPMMICCYDISRKPVTSTVTAWERFRGREATAAANAFSDRETPSDHRLCRCIIASIASGSGIDFLSTARARPLKITVAPERIALMLNLTVRGLAAVKAWASRDSSDIPGEGLAPARIRKLINLRELSF